jgi:hypothetical protein
MALGIQYAIVILVFDLCVGKPLSLWMAVSIFPQVKR